MKKSTFKAKIYKVGINPCVKIPTAVTEKMTPVKGYIRVKGKIGDHTFRHTLVPVKNAGYRLFVNGPMLKGAGVKVGDTVRFSIEQDFGPAPSRNTSMPKALKKELNRHNLTSAFNDLTPSRKKEILKYLNYLKTEDALARNIIKVISQLKKKNKNLRLP